MPRSYRRNPTAYDISSPDDPLPGAVAAAPPPGSGQQQQPVGMIPAGAAPAAGPATQMTAQGAAIRSNMVKGGQQAAYLGALAPSADPQVNALRAAKMQGAQAHADLLGNAAG